MVTLLIASSCAAHITVIMRHPATVMHLAHSAMAVVAWQRASTQTFSHSCLLLKVGENFFKILLLVFESIFYSILFEWQLFCKYM